MRVKRVFSGHAALFGSVRRALNRCVSLTAVCVCALIIAFALLLGAIRLAAPYADHYKHFILERLSAAAEQPLSVARMQVELDGWSPRVRLDGVKVLDDTGAESLLDVEQVYVAFDLKRSLFERRVKFEDVSIVTGDLRIVREDDGALHLYGLGGDSQTGMEQYAFADALHDIRLNLLSSKVRFEDQRLNIDYSLRDVHIAFVSGADEHKLQVVAAVPGTIGQTLRLAANIRGALDQPAGWSGKVYARLEDVQVASVAGNALRDTGIDRGVISLETWSDWRESAMVRLTGTFQVSEAGMQRVAYRNGLNARWQIPDQLRGRVLWLHKDSGWSLKIDDLQAAGLTDGGPDARVTVELENHAGNQRVVRGTLNHARLDSLLSLAVDEEQLDDELSEWLRHATPLATLRNVRFMAALEGERIVHYGGSGEVIDLRVEPYKKVPGVAGLDGVFSLDDAGGELSLTSDDLRFTYPAWFAQDLSLDVLRSQLEWTHAGGEVWLEADIAQLQNSDLQANGTLNMRFGKGSPYLDLKLDYHGVDVASAVRYYPEKIMVPRIHRWLTRSLVAGYVPSGQLVFTGDVGRFPFKDGSGLFEARFDVENAVLDYKKDWPRATHGSAQLIFRNSSLTGHVRSARLLGSHVTRASGKIADFKQAELVIDGESAGPLADIVTYLDRSALITKRSIVHKLDIGGGGKLALDIRLPLSRKLKAEGKRARVSGQLDFDGSSLDIPALDLAFKGIRGSVEFGPDGGQGKGIRAILAGSPLEVSAAHADGGATRLDVRGRVESTELLRALKHPVFSAIGGPALWSGQIDLPPYRKDHSGAPVSVRLASDLRGVRVDWPAPIGKTSEQARAFSLTTVINGEGRYDLSYGQHTAAIELTAKQGIERAEFRLADGAAVMPNEGIRVRGRVDEFAVGEWLPWFSTLRTGGDTDHAGRLQAIDLRAGKFLWSGYSLDGLELNIVRDASNWLVKAASPSMQGRMMVPVAFDTGQPLVVELDHLRLSGELADDNGGSALVLDPTDLPPIRFSTRSLRFNDFEFSDVSLATAPLADGLEVRHLQASAPQFQATGTGDWRTMEGGVPRSSFQAQLTSANLQQTLDAWKIPHTFRGATAKANVGLAWLDAPYRFTFHGLQGKANIDIEDGTLKELEPGAGRLLGLFNLSALPRRLSFDFSDLFERGFKFDRIRGNLAFVSSNVYTSDLSIDSTAANIVIRGRTGLEARDYDQFVTVIPEVSSSLPLAGVIFGGPAVGAAMFLADQIFDEVGEGINSAVRIKYRVTGSWDEPTVEVAEMQARKARAKDYSERR
ncbi:MAG: YhdP family protein [Gammaproteobacteria bacterium]